MSLTVVHHKVSWTIRAHEFFCIGWREMQDVRIDNEQRQTLAPMMGALQWCRGRHSQGTEIPHISYTDSFQTQWRERFGELLGDIGDVLAKRVTEPRRPSELAAWQQTAAGILLGAVSGAGLGPCTCRQPPSSCSCEAPLLWYILVNGCLLLSALLDDEAQLRHRIL